MNAYLFSIGESTTDLAQWSLERLGFKVHVLFDPKTSLYDKYVEFLDRADGDVVLRMDADMIATRGLNTLIQAFRSQSEFWWMSGKAYCHLKHDLIDASTQLMSREVIHVGRRHFKSIDPATSRPETAFSRLPDFYNPRRFTATDIFTSIHGYKQRPEDIERVMKQKDDRHQLGQWDVERINKMNSL